MKLPSWGLRPERSSTGSPRLRDRMERLFENLLADPFREIGTVGPTVWAPDIDVKQREHDIEIRVELPGLEAGDIQINVQGNLLSISGEKKEEREEGAGEYSYREIAYGAFQRLVELPEGADAEQVEAHYDKGVLQIRIQKKADSKPKRIAIKPAEAKAQPKQNTDDLDEPSEGGGGRS
jgi:HSP20 family protein